MLYVALSSLSAMAVRSLLWHSRGSSHPEIIEVSRLSTSTSYTLITVIDATPTAQTSSNRAAELVLAVKATHHAPQGQNHQSSISGAISIDSTSHALDHSDRNGLITLL